MDSRTHILALSTLVLQLSIESPWFLWDLFYKLAYKKEQITWDKVNIVLDVSCLGANMRVSLLEIHG